jgi:ADP-ribosyl-[dinitrogen reductase] hydrolase
MIGAIIGDIVGSRFEFDNFKSKDFEMFDTECDFTDDSVMTLAIAKALQSYEIITDMEEFKKHLVKVMHEVGMRYPHCGYGGRFYVWMMKNHTEPYNSFGNGSAMRVSPVGWFSNSLEACEALAAATAEVTHNHPEGIKGAVAVAGAIYLSRTGHSMDEIKEYIKNYYTIDFTLDEIRDDYDFYEICQKSVPQALEAFFESTSFEDAIRNAISIGGDSDTIAAITGSIAEAFYGADEDMKETALSYLDSYLLDIADSFVNKFINKES